MKKMTNWEELQWRGLVKDVAGDMILSLIRLYVFAPHCGHT